MRVRRKRESASERESECKGSQQQQQQLRPHLVEDSPPLGSSERTSLSLPEGLSSTSPITHARVRARKLVEAQEARMSGANEPLPDGNPIYGPFFGVMGAASAIIFSALGAAYGTAKSGTGIAAMSVMRPELIMKSIIPVVMAGIIAIYGLVVAVLIAGALEDAKKYTLYRGFVHLGAGLAVGFSGLAAGFAIGIVGDAGVRGTAQQPRLFVGMILILIFAEVLGLYGLIVAIYLYTKQN